MKLGRLTMLLTPLVVITGCTKTIETVCPSFPWPTDPVIDFMQEGSKASGAVGMWWRDVIRHGTVCDEISKG
jgi:hypothetical protein